MTSSERFVRIAALPSRDGWTAEIAIDRSGGAARAVVLTAVPAAVADDPARLAALVRDVEAAARLHHPHVLPVIGLEGLGESLAIVETFRAGVTLRQLLDAGGRMPADVAARIAADACAAVAFALERDAGEGTGLVHGRLAPERLVVAEDGLTLVAGFGAPAEGASPAVDAAALAAIVYECVAGEPPAEAPRALELSGVPDALAAVLFRALRGDGYGDAAAFARALVAASAPAAHEAVAAYAEAILPADDPERAAIAFAIEEALARDASQTAEEEVTDELILGDPTPPPEQPAPTPPLATPSPMISTPTPEPATAPMPASPAASARAETPALTPPLGSLSPTAPTPPSASATAVASASAAGPDPDPAPDPARDRDPEPGRDLGPTRPPSLSDAQILPVPSRPAPSSSWWALTAAVSLACAAAGFAAGLMVERKQRAQERDPAPVAAAPAAPATARASTPAPVSAAPAPRAPAAGARDQQAAAETPAPVRKAAATRAQAPKAAPIAKATRPAAQPKTASQSLEVGWLDVHAPEGAEIYVDGRRIGIGEVRRHELTEGTHHVEVRLGDARTGETFTIGPRETYTYQVHRTAH